MKRRLSNPSSAYLTIRCTTQERDLWARRAQSRNRSLSDLVRAGLTAAAAHVCLCAPGEPICTHCRATELVRHLLEKHADQPLPQPDDVELA